jgi:hypothetical protein
MIYETPTVVKKTCVVLQTSGIIQDHRETTCHKLLAFNNKKQEAVEKNLCSVSKTYYVLLVVLAFNS